jgi:hypothetical protein
VLKHSLLTPDLTSTVALLHLPCAAVAVPRGSQLRLDHQRTKRHVAAALHHIDGLQYASIALRTRVMPVPGPSYCTAVAAYEATVLRRDSGRFALNSLFCAGLRPAASFSLGQLRSPPGSTRFCSFLIPAGSNTPGAGAGGRRARRRRRGRARSRLDCWPARKQSTCWHCAKGSFALLHRPHKSQHGESCSRASARTAVAARKALSAYGPHLRRHRGDGRRGCAHAPRRVPRAALDHARPWSA